MKNISSSTPSVFAVAPVATIRASAVYSAFGESGSIGSVAVTTRNGRLDRSTSTTASYRQSAPNFLAWARIFSISSGPSMPSGQPGKFSTTVVQVSWPPGSLPSKTIGARLARAA